MSHYDSDNNSDGNTNNVQEETSNRRAANRPQHGSDSNAPPRSLSEYAKGTYDPQKPLLLYATKQPKRATNTGGGSRDWNCNICGHSWVGSYSRVRQHLLGIPGKGVNVCIKLTAAQKSELLRLQMAADGKGLFSSKNVTSQPHSSGIMSPPTMIGSEIGSSRSCAIGATITGMYNVDKRDRADGAIGRFIFANGIPFHVSRSPYYKEMVAAIADVGTSYVPPGEHKLRTTILENEVSKINVQKEDMRQTWARCGCSIVMDGWTDIAKRPLINIIVTSTAGPFFLRAIDCSGKRKDASFQYELLRDAIEDVGVDNVVQVVTDAAAVCRSAGLLIQSRYQHIYWTPCCVHALNNALKDIGKIQWISDLVTAARDVQMFICNHHTSLAMYRAHTRKEFLKPTDTRYASYFLLLERMLEVQAPLQALVVSPEWARWSESKTDMAKKVRTQVLDNDWWADCSYLVSFLGPIVEVIRYTDSDSPSLGEVYETFDSMLGRVKLAIKQREPSLDFYTTQVRPIIQRRWDRMNTPLHMAAYAINPKWYVERAGRVPPIDDAEVKNGFLDAIGKMYSEEEGAKLRRQFVQFASLSGPFNKRGARVDRIDLGQDDPIGWWRIYGDGAPELKHLAIRLLSQIASSSAAERNWSTYSFIHSIKRNRLTSRRAEKLVAVHSALRLEHRKTPEYLKGPATRWDVDPEDDAQVDVEEGPNETQHGLVGVPLSMFEDANDSDSEGDTPMVDPDLFVQQLDAETSGALP